VSSRHAARWRRRLTDEEQWAIRWRGDLTEKEQRAVRTALRFLRWRTGAWLPLAKALRLTPSGIEKIVNGRRAVTPKLVVRIARLVEVPIDDLLAGRYLSERTCPHCGRPPDDFEDEDTRIE
jgi:transcriptional regulator with XRE-family HTH domain